MSFPYVQLRQRFTGQAAVRRVHKSHVGLREGDPARHRAHVPGARFLQREGRPGPGKPLQRHEGLLAARQRGRILPGIRLHRGPTAHAGTKLICIPFHLKMHLPEKRPLSSFSCEIYPFNFDFIQMNFYFGATDRCRKRKRSPWWSS